MTFHGDNCGLKMYIYMYIQKAKIGFNFTATYADLKVLSPRRRYVDMLLGTSEICYNVAIRLQPMYNVHMYVE